MYDIITRMTRKVALYLYRKRPQVKPSADVQTQQTYAVGRRTNSADVRSQQTYEQ